MNVATATTASGPHWLLRKSSLQATSVFLLVVVCSLLALAKDTRFVYMLVYVWFGLAYGMLLQYGRFCMASAVRDLFAVKVPRMAVGMMIAVALYAVVAAIVTLAGFSTFHPNAMGWHIVIGAAIFGFGIVFTGGCASGSLYKAGEGNMNSMLVILAISFSQAIVVSASGWWDSAGAAVLGRRRRGAGHAGRADDHPGLVRHLHRRLHLEPQGHHHRRHVRHGGHHCRRRLDEYDADRDPAGLPSFWLRCMSSITARATCAAPARPTRPCGDEIAGMWAMFTSSKNTAIAGIGLGILAGLHMYVTGVLREHYDIFNFGELLVAMGYTSGLSIQDTVFDPGYWYITTQEAQWGGWVMQQLGIDSMDSIFFGLDNGLPNPLLNAPGFMSIGIILGASVMALARREFKWKLPNWESAFFAIVGGTLMGIGARLAMGCNIGAFFATVTNGDPSGWVFLFGMTIGAYIGVKAFTWYMDWSDSRKTSECGL